MSTTRRGFLQSSLFGASAVALLTACGDDDDGGDPDVDAAEAADAPGNPPGDAAGSPDSAPPSDAAPLCATGATGILFVPQHGHAVTVPKIDIDAGLQKTYSIKGTSPHTHSITLMPADFTQLAAGNPVVTMSTSTNGHTHQVTVSC